MGDRIDSKIEMHRTDPDPHPRWRKQIDAQISGLEDAIALLAPDGEVPVIPEAGTATPQPVAHGVPAQPGTAAPFAHEDHRHALVLPPNVEAIANITGTGVVQRDNAGALRAIQQAIGLIGVWDADGMSSRPKLQWDDATATLEPQNAFTLDNVETDHYGRGTLSKSSGWLWTAAWGEAMGGYWLRNDYTVGGNQTVTITYGATIGGGDCGFSVKLFLGQPAGTPKHTIDFPLGRFRIFQDQDTLYVYNASGAVLWSRLLPTVAGGEPEEYITIAVTASGATATVYQDGIQVATGAADAGSAAGVTVTFADWAWPNQYRTCGFCELTSWDRLPSSADLLAAKLRTHPVAGATPDRLGIGPDADLLVHDHAAATHRLQRAAPDGTLTPIPEAQWDATNIGLYINTTYGSLGIRKSTGSTNGVEMHIRPYEGYAGYWTFTENNIADRWAVGVKPGDAALYFRSGSIDAGTDRAALTAAGEWKVWQQAGTGTRLVAAGADGTQEVLANPGTEGGYGAAGETLGITVDLQGRISGAAAVPIRIVTSQVDGLAATLEYDVDDRLSVVTTANGTKTMAYNVDGTLATITGTGSYQSKSFTYTDGRLTGVAIT